MLMSFFSCREHFEEATKYARRSVSDQDIRRYEMFSQVHTVHPHFLTSPQPTKPSPFSFRTYNSLVVSAPASSSLRVPPQNQEQEELPLRTLDSPKKLKMTICTLD
jgi:hypothetical protein